jgi:NitT/TauT family transport system permease protein
MSVTIRLPAVSEASLTRFLGTITGRTLARVVLALILLAAWEYQPNPDLRFWMSGPVEIVARLWGWMLDGSLWDNVVATLLAMVLGYALGSASGISLGLLFGLMPRLSRVLSPYITALYAMPKIALAPLFVIVLGIGIESKVALVAITVLFLVLNSTLDGVRNVDGDLVRALSLMGARRSEVVCKVLVPATLPWIFTGMRIAIRYAFTNTLLAELIAANRGIGFMIEYYSGVFDATGTYAAILTLVIMSVGLTELLTAIEAKMSRGRGQ